MKALILLISVVLMLVLVAMSIGGLVWMSDASLPTRTGGQFALAVAGLGGCAGLVILWAARPKHS